MSRLLGAGRVRRVSGEGASSLALPPPSAGLTRCSVWAARLPLPSPSARRARWLLHSFLEHDAAASHDLRRARGRVCRGPARAVTEDKDAGGNAEGGDNANVAFIGAFWLFSMFQIV